MLTQVKPKSKQIPSPNKVEPHRKRMSYEAYLTFASETQIMDWVDGEVLIYMPPTPEHQKISRFLVNILDPFIQYFKAGELLFAPLEVKLWPDGPSREPDVLFIGQDNLAQLTPKRFEGGPDLIIEIISPSSVTEDRVRKFTHYEQAGVREYWLIDPRPRQRQVDFYVLGSDGLFQVAPLDEVGRYHSHVLPNFWLDPTWLWQEPLPNPQAALAAIMVSIEGLPTETKQTYQTLRDILSKS